jgi:serine/threonine protein phosphatase PrpC
MRDQPSSSVDKRVKDTEVKGTHRSLSNYNKTKGGSLIFNVSQQSMMGDEKIEFVDEQNITSPPKADWKVGKAIKRAPDMKETVAVPVVIPQNQGGGVIKAEVGYKTLQGKNPRPPHKPNQDALSIFIVEGHPNLVVFACFDGHGPYGEHASQFCRSRLHPAMLNQGNDMLNTDPRQAFINAIADVHAQFCSDETTKQGVDPVVSGTTCVALLFEGKNIHIANVGDSRAIVGTIDSMKKQLKADPLTDDHKPQRPDERARLEQSSALLLTEREVRGFGDDSKIYICRERGGDIVYGVLFTRSLGDADAHIHLGVSAIPEMGLRTLGDNDRYFILASDGVWDYMTNEEVMDYCATNSDPLKAAEAIVADASERWATRDADNRRDDITVLVVKTDLIEPLPPIDGAAAAPAEAPQEESGNKD